MSIEHFFSPPDIGPVQRGLYRQERRELFWTGIFILVMGLTLLLGLWLLSSGTSKTIRYHTYFDRTYDLRPGNQVQQGGYPIGSVMAVTPEFQPDFAARPHFRVDFRIRQTWPVWQGSKIYVSSAGPLQGMLMELIPGDCQQNCSAWPPSKAMPGDVETDLVEQINSMVAYIQNHLLIEQISPLLASLQEQVDGLRILTITQKKQPSGVEELYTSLQNLRKISNDLQTKLHAIDPDALTHTLLAEVHRMVDHGESLLVTLKQHSQGLPPLLTQYQKVGKSIDSLVGENRPQIKASMADIRFMMQEFATILGPILRNLEGTTRDLEALARDVRRNPAVLLGGRKTMDNSPGSN